jgi:hypothetical protein
MPLIRLSLLLHHILQAQFVLCGVQGGGGFHSQVRRALLSTSSEFDELDGAFSRKSRSGADYGAFP